MAVKTPNNNLIPGCKSSGPLPCNKAHAAVSSECFCVSKTGGRTSWRSHTSVLRGWGTGGWKDPPASFTWGFLLVMLQGPYTFIPPTQFWSVCFLLKVGHHGSSWGYFVSGGVGLKHFAFQTMTDMTVYESFYLQLHLILTKPGWLKPAC